MNDNLYIQHLYVYFQSCPDTDTARERFRHLVLRVNEWYPGVVQLLPGGDPPLEHDGNVSIPARLGVRIDEYDSNGFSESPGKYGGESPDPWVIATDVLTNLDTFSEGVSIFSRSNYIDATKPMDFDIAETGEFSENYINDHVTVWVEIGSANYSTPPDWVTGTSSAIYHVGSKTYDTREYGGANPSVEVGDTAIAIVEQAVEDLLPGHVRNQRWQDRPAIQARLPSSLASRIDSYHGWKELLWRTTSIQVLKEPGLGFRSPKDVHGYYEEV